MKTNEEIEYINDKKEAGGMSVLTWEAMKMFANERTPKFVVVEAGASYDQLITQRTNTIK